MSRSDSQVAVERLLGGHETAWLIARVRGRILAAQGEPMTGVVQLRDPSPEQRAAAVRLTGLSPRAGSILRVDLAVVEQILRRGPWPAGLADAVQALTGPVVDAAAARQREADAWDAARAVLVGAAGRFPGLPEWWDGWCAGGGLKRFVRAEAARTGQQTGPALAAELVRQVADLLAVLPVSGEPLAMLARRVAGDAHALDDARPAGRVAAAVVGAAFAPARDVSIRDAWAAAGVVLSNVASTVLCLGVPGDVPATSASRSRGWATAAALEAMRAARMPLVLTLDQVRSGGVAPLPRDAVVYVCENPTVVEVIAERWTTADTALAAEPVLVCTWGNPSTAVVELLKILTGEGAQCRYHGDFDWAGLRIARTLRQRIAWTPWRYTAADYIAAAEEGSPSRTLTGRPAESLWDPELACAMAEHGLAIEEEAMAEMLATDVLVRRHRAEVARHW